MESNCHEKLMNSLQEKHRKILDLIDGQSVQYIDIPMYMNIGDHLIAHGTFKFLEENQVNIVRATSLYCFRESWIDETDVLLFGGGGNFGDLYYEHHAVRRNIIQKALEKGKIVVVLPQSIWYQDDLRRLEDRLLFKDNRNFHLFTRDEQSYDIGRTLSSNVYLVPDMAHHIYNELMEISKKVKIQRDVMYFLRNDKEAISHRDSEDLSSVDWCDLLRAAKYSKKLSKVYKLYHTFKRYHVECLDMKLKLWRRVSWCVVKECAFEFSKYQSVVTDRLHGMIFTVLLNRNVYVIDNSYEKLSNYQKLWLDNDPTVKYYKSKK